MWRRRPMVDGGLAVSASVPATYVGLTTLHTNRDVLVNGPEITIAPVRNRGAGR